MKFLDFENILPRLHDVKIELIPPGKRCKPWPLYVRYGVKVYSSCQIASATITINDAAATVSTICRSSMMIEA
jgi:hypothetical protein